MKYTYLIIDDSPECAARTKAIAEGFSELECVGVASSFEEGLHLILEQTPDLVFLEIVPNDKKSGLSLSLISEIHRFLKIIPEIIITTSKKDWAFDAIDYGVLDYYLKPVHSIQLLKTIHKLAKKKATSVLKPESQQRVLEISTPIQEVSFQKQNGPMTICIKSYGDYRYINADDICYFQADNNSTDIHLCSGEMVTAFKTLKHFETVLTYPFLRIHNSYIVNRNYISRIQMGNSLCFIKNSSKKIPFSKSYKTQIDSVISDFSQGNYVEI
jgi:two-component system, LytTR family, response regulator